MAGDSLMEWGQGLGAVWASTAVHQQSGPVGHENHPLPIALPTSQARPSAASLVWSARITSSSRISLRSSAEATSRRSRAEGAIRPFSDHFERPASTACAPRASA